MRWLSGPNAPSNATVLTGAEVEGTGQRLERIADPGQPALEWTLIDRVPSIRPGARCQRATMLFVPPRSSDSGMLTGRDSGPDPKEACGAGRLRSRSSTGRLRQRVIMQRADWAPRSHTSPVRERSTDGMG
jgi:hypothetical protein